MDMKKIEDVLQDEPKTIAITGHIHPDGDCVGSCLGLASYLSKILPHAEIGVYLQPFDPSFLFLRGADQIRHSAPENYRPDLAFALDCGDEERMGENQKCFQAASMRVCIDHHYTNMGFGDICLIQGEASSTCEVLFGLMDPSKIDRETAECLYLGIVHDTGVFQHSNTSEYTMRCAGQLISKGAKPEQIIVDTFYKKTFAQNKALGRALDSANLYLDGKMIAAAITQKDLRELGLTARELDGIVNQLRLTEGVEIALFLYETEPGIFKASLRATGEADVSRIARHYGGGGHIKAAGCSIPGEWKEIAGEISVLAEQLR